MEKGLQHTCELSYFSVETQLYYTCVCSMTSDFHESDKEINLVTLWSHFCDGMILFCQIVYLCLCTYACSSMAYFYIQPKINTIKTVSLQSSELFLACVVTEAFTVISVPG